MFPAANRQSTMDMLVQAVDGVSCLVGCLRRSEDEHLCQHKSMHCAAKGIAHITAMLAYPQRYQGMSNLHQHSSRASQVDNRLAGHLPCHTLSGEIATIFHRFP